MAASIRSGGASVMSRGRSSRASALVNGANSVLSAQRQNMRNTSKTNRGMTEQFEMNDTSMLQTTLPPEVAAVADRLAPGENIYNWVRRDLPAAEKPRRYRSKHNPKQGPDVSTFKEVTRKKPTATMGREVKKTIQPQKFMKAHEKTGSGMVTRTKPKKFQRSATTRKPPVPSRDEKPVYGVKSDKDYVVANAVDNILAVPPNRQPSQPDYLRKSEYGKIPSYLQSVKQEVEAERELIQNILDEEEMQNDTGPRYREMPEDEREELLAALKAKWDTVNHEYQKITWKDISTSNSTFGQIRAKEQCEQQLDELEKDIQRLSAKGPIYVVDDQ